MNSCETVCLQMTAYLAGELSEEQLAAFREHLEHCPDCRNELEELSKTWTLTKQALDASAGNDVLPDENRSAVRKAAESPRFRFRLVPAVWKVAASIAVCGAVLALVIHSVKPRSKASAAPRGEYNVPMEKTADVKSISAPLPAAQPSLKSNAAVRKNALPEFAVADSNISDAVPPSRAAKKTLGKEKATAVSWKESSFRGRAAVAEAIQKTEAAEPEDELELPFADFPEIRKRDVKSILEFFVKKNIPLNEENITLSAEPKKFRVKASAELLRKIRVCQKKKDHKP